MTQEPVTDSENRSWTRGPELGRGTWARTWQLVGPDQGRAVLKTPLTAEDFPGDDPERIRELAAACRAAADHQAAWLREAAPEPWVPELWGTVSLGDGRTGLVLPDLGPALGTQDLSIVEALDSALAIAALLAASPRAHGQLRPSNVFVASGDSSGIVVLSDWLTEPVGALRTLLSARAGLEGWTPPDVAPRAEVVDDTWALARWLVEVLVGEVPTGGVPRDAASALREQLVQRLIAADGLPRFVDRTADRIGTLVARALSVEAEPSPPFRFHDWGPLVERLQEARALLEPRVVDVGPVVWPAWRPDETFGAEEPVAFSVRVTGSPGLEEPGDVVCGLRLDAVQGEEPVRVPVPGAAVQVRAERDARFRFRLELPPLPAGRYRVVAAFAVEGTGASPVTAEASFAVDPAAIEAELPAPGGPSFAQDRTTLVPDDLDEAVELPDPRLSEAEEDALSTEPGIDREEVSGLDEGTFARSFDERPVAPPAGDRGVGWVLGLSAALAVLAVLSYVARSC